MADRRKNTLRLTGYDYSQAGAYFTKIVTHRRRPILSVIREGQTILSRPGEIVEEIWHQLPQRFPRIALDRYVIMPDHIHAIIIIETVGAIHELPLRTEGNRPIQSKNRLGMLIPKAIGFFKMNSAKRINLHIERSGRPFWQRGYFEHIIRNQADLESVRS